MVGGDHVAQKGKHLGTLDILDGFRVHRHALEVGRVLDIGRGRRPVIGQAVGGFDAAPFLVALEDVGVFLLERLARHGLLDEVGDFLLRRPEILEVDVVAVLVLGDRILRDVDIHVARQRIDHHERRRGEVVGAHVRADPALEVAVAGEDRGRDQVVVADRLGNFRLERP